MKNIDRFERMESWTKEKSLMALNETTELLAFIRDNEFNINKSIYNEIMEYIYSILIDNCKVYSLIFDKDIDVNSKRIFMFGKEGLEETLFELGLKDNTALRVKINELDNFINKLTDLVKGDRTNRTLIHQLLNSYKPMCSEINGQIRKLEEYIEDVTIGKREWIDYIIVAKAIIPELIKYLNKLKERQENIQRT